MRGATGTRPPRARVAAPTGEAPAPRPRLLAQLDALEAQAAARADGEQAVAARMRLRGELERLDRWQLAAVLDGVDDLAHDAGSGWRDGRATLVRAQVGSGKTTLLASKVQLLHLYAGVPLERIAVLTFTTRAARHIEAALARLRGAPGALLGEASGPLAGTEAFGTFHAVARSLLTGRLPLASLGYPAQLQVSDDDERMLLLIELIEAHGLRVGRRRALPARLAAMRSRLKRGQPISVDDDLPRLEALVEAESRRSGVMSFDELLDAATTLLQRAPLAPPYDWVLIDELQDCSEAELAFVDALRGGRLDRSARGGSEGRRQARLFAVGDPNQQIYGWRGGRFELLEAAARRWSAGRRELPRNYRSSAPILSLARAVLPGALKPCGAAPAGAEGQAPTARQAGSDAALPRLLRHHDGVTEATYLARRLAAALSADPDRRCAVLARTRRQLQVVAGALEVAGLRVTQQLRLCERDLPAATWLLRLLRAGLAGDEASARYALLHARLGCLRRLPREREGIPALVAALESELASPAGGGRRCSSARGSSSARGRHDPALGLAVLCALDALPAALEALSDSAPRDAAATLRAHLGLDSLLVPTATRYSEDAAELQRWLAHWLGEARRRRRRGQSAADALLEVLTLATLEGSTPPTFEGEGAEETAAGQRQAHPISLLTIHAAKGLEFDDVSVIGLNDGVLPFARGFEGSDPAELAEEQRLLFVAITRARHHLELSYHTAPDRPSTAPEPSRFLIDIAESTLTRGLPEAVTRGAPEARPASAPVAAPSAGPARAAAGGFAVGDQVRHRKYGFGEVTSLANDHVHVRFARYGDKRFMAAACPLIRIADGP